MTGGPSDMPTCAGFDYRGQHESLPHFVFGNRTGVTVTNRVTSAQHAHTPCSYLQGTTLNVEFTCRAHPITPCSRSREPDCRRVWSAHLIHRYCSPLQEIDVRIPF